MRRPVGVWIVTAYFAITLTGTLISLGEFVGGELTLTPEQRAYFQSLGPVDYLGAASTLVLCGWAAIELFQLHKRAVAILGVVLIMNLGATAYQFLVTNWTDALGTAGLASVAGGLSLLAIILVYAVSLRRRGILT